MTVAEHRDRVAQVGCIVTKYPYPTIHHVHGGSIIERWGKRHGGAKLNEALILPLKAELHTGKFGIDTAMSVPEWEARFGAQAGFLDELSALIGYSVWELAEIWEREEPKMGTRRMAL